MHMVTSPTIAILLAVLTMLGWGSWANTQKLANRSNWPFGFFYWDYAIGIFLFAALLALLPNGTAPTGVLAGMQSAGTSAIERALFAGVLFNISNLLLVIAIDLAGMALAFPVGVGLALIIGTVASYVQEPHGSLPLLGFGVALVLLAMIFSAIANFRMHAGAGQNTLRGLSCAVVAGSLMGFFYPQLIKSMSPHSTASGGPVGGLTPVSALLLFAAGLLLSNIVLNTILMRVKGLAYTGYFLTGKGLHLWGILGGAIWMFALTCNLFASGAAGPAISYALGQGATLIAALWGAVVWHEFRNAPAGTWRYVIMMFVAYTVGLTLIGTATFF